MARGWESKSVESQMEAAENGRRYREAQGRRTPEEIERERRRASLLLERTRVVQEIQASVHARYRAMLQQSLMYLDGELAKLDV